MKPVRYLGINFRSVRHKDWFKSSLLILTASLLSYFLLSVTFKTHAREIFSFLTIIYLCVVLVVLDKTNFGKINNEVVSRDCIWFNSFLATIYYAFYVLSKHI